MDTKGRLVAGSHNRNEFVLINADDIGRVTSVKELSRQICQICADEVEITVYGEPFVACNECAFPVCWPCYEYERREGSQACPQCKTRFKRIKEILDVMMVVFWFKDDSVLPDKHALIIPSFMSRGKKVHPIPFPDSTISLPPRPMDPKMDLAVYGYGGIAWKDRMEEWKKIQNDKLQIVKHDCENGGNYDECEPYDPDLRKYLVASLDPALCSEIRRWSREYIVAMWILCWDYFVGNCILYRILYRLYQLDGRFTAGILPDFS